MNEPPTASMNAALKRRIVVVANCQGLEIARYLRSSLNLSCQYDIIYISSIILMENESEKTKLISEISNAHVVVAQDVTSVPWLRNDYIATMVPKDCRFFRFSFWRFYGYWPVPAEKFHPQMWYICNEIAPDLQFKDYIGHSVPTDTISRNFDEQVDRFARIERTSELKMLPFVLENHKTHRLFTDEWHPTPFFFLQVARYIISELDLVDDITLLPDDGVDNFRHRFILDDVADKLGLQFDQNFVRYHDVNLSRDVLYAYFKFAQAHYDRVIPWLHPRENFYSWTQSREADACDAEIGQYGTVSASPRTAISSVGVWGALKTVAGRMALPSPNPQPHRSWSIDLRDFRRISAMHMRLSGVQRDQVGSLPLAISNDGQTWKDVAVVRLPHARDPDAPLVLTFSDPLFARHVRLSWSEPERFEVRDADVYMRVVSLP